jgi:hypothetical protein
MVAIDKDAGDDEPVVADEVVPENDEDIDDGMIRRDVEPEPDDPGDVIELVRTGLVRITIGTDRFRLRRPFFGEFKDLRLAIEAVNDEVQAAVDESILVSRQIAAENEEHADDDPTEFIERRAENRKKTTASTRHLTEIVELRRVEWWDQMWDLLTLDGRPDQFPAWIIDPQISTTLLGHWRSSPSGRG